MSGAVTAPPIRAAIFDLDGTLLDSMGVWSDIDAAFLQRRGIALPEDYFDAISGLTFFETAVYTAERFGLCETPESMMAEWREMAAYAYAHEVPLKPGARDYLDALKENGIKLGVATSLSPPLAEACLKSNGIYAYFEAFCFTEELGVNKQSPTIFIETARRLGVEPAQCAVFEDLLLAMRSAHTGGMHVFGVYDKYAKEQHDEMRRFGSGFIRHWAEAPVWDGRTK